MGKTLDFTFRWSNLILFIIFVMVSSEGCVLAAK